MTPSFDPSPLKAFLAALGVEYHYLANPIVDRAAEGQLQGDSLCAFCSRMKRGLLYGCCREHGFNKLVLGQHLDDLAESFIMSILHNGQARTMKANYRVEAGDVSVIRPLIYCREHMTKDFAVAAKLPVSSLPGPAAAAGASKKSRGVVLSPHHLSSPPNRGCSRLRLLLAALRVPSAAPRPSDHQ